MLLVLRHLPAAEGKCGLDLGLDADAPSRQDSPEGECRPRGARSMAFIFWPLFFFCTLAVEGWPCCSCLGVRITTNANISYNT